MADDWVIRKNGYFYRPNRAGYTSDIREAGRYSESEAKAEAAIEPERMSARLASEFEPKPRASNPTLGSAYERELVAGNQRSRAMNHAGIVRKVGWDELEDGQRIFRAVIDFPDGPPDLPFDVVWKQRPVELWLSETVPAPAEK